MNSPHRTVANIHIIYQLVYSHQRKSIKNFKFPIEIITQLKEVRKNLEETAKKQRVKNLNCGRCRCIGFIK